MTTPINPQYLPDLPGVSRVARRLLAVSLALGLASLGFAQTRPAAAASSSDDDRVVELSPFVISSYGDDGSIIDEATAGTLVARPLEKLPMALTVVSAELMQEIGVLNADGLSNLVAGVANQTHATTQGSGDNTFFTVRAFNNIPRRNGFAPGGRLYDHTGVERVEVIKGPNSLLYGQGAPGGIINYVSKRPRIHNDTGVRGTVTAAVGNYDFFRTQMDVNATLLPGKLAFRLPASYTTHGREFDWFTNEVQSYNPSLLARPFKNTEILLEYEYLQIDTERAGGFQPVIWAPPGAPAGAAGFIVDKTRRGLGRTANVQGPDMYARNLMRNYTIDLTTNLTENITFRGVYSGNKRDRNEQAWVEGEPFAVTPRAFQAQWLWDGNAIYGYKGDLLFQYDIGPFKTRTIVGYEFNQNDFFVTNYRTYTSSTGVPGNAGFVRGTVLRYHTLDLGYNNDTRRVSRAPVASDFAAFPTNERANMGILGINETQSRLGANSNWGVQGQPARFRSEWTNIRVSEVLSAYDDRLQLMGGVARGESSLINLRTGGVQAQEKDTFQVGAGFFVIPQHMFFINRSTSYQPQFLFDVNFEPLPAQTGEGNEIGIKSNWGQSGLITTLTYFDQARINVGRQFNDQELQRTYGVLTPGEEAKGFEVEVTYRPNKRLTVQGAYTQFTGKVTGTNFGQEFKIGRPLPRSPEKSAVFSAFYNFEEGLLAKVRLGLGVNYKSATELDVNTGINSTLWLSDARTVFWMSASREFKLQGRRAVVVRLNVGNLLNKEFITEGQTYGDPRTIRLATDFKF
jgi:iron complex outermembrane recepter protein